MKADRFSMPFMRPASCLSILKVITSGVFAIVLFCNTTEFSNTVNFKLGADSRIRDLSQCENGQEFESRTKRLHCRHSSVQIAIFEPL